jgi:hypothetical protein
MISLEVLAERRRIAALLRRAAQRALDRQSSSGMAADHD